MKYAHINFNPKKEFIIAVQLPNEKGELQDVEIISLKQT
jgi:hypothetical protein